MTLNGVDVASYQTGINFTQVPCDFAIIKATEGTSYVNPACNTQYSSAKNAGKLLGLYHYVKGNGAVAEANFFIDNIKNYVGSAILCIDWEAGGNVAWGNMDYLRQLCQQVIARTGVRPLIYVQASAYAPVSGVAKSLNCGMWVAQYASMAATGYQSHPWNEGKYACAIRQYASTGRLPGWGGSLDLNLAYMDRGAWMKYANPSGAPAPAPAPAPAAPAAPSTPQIAVDGIIGAATVRRWQTVMGTAVDGVISDQLAVNYKPALVAVNHNQPYGQSQLVRAVQRVLGVTVDGLLGPETIKALQRRLGVTVDGILGPNTAKALQQRLNEGRF